MALTVNKLWYVGESVFCAFFRSIARAGGGETNQSVVAVRGGGRRGQRSERRRRLPGRRAGTAVDDFRRRRCRCSTAQRGYACACSSHCCLQALVALPRPSRFEAPQDTIGHWLERLGLADLAVTFVANGYDSLDVIRTMKQEDLEGIGALKGAAGNTH